VTPPTTATAATMMATRRRVRRLAILRRSASRSRLARAYLAALLPPSVKAGPELFAFRPVLIAPLAIPMRARRAPAAEETELVSRCNHGYAS